MCSALPDPATVPRLCFGPPCSDRRGTSVSVRVWVIKQGKTEVGCKKVPRGLPLGRAPATSWNLPIYGVPKGPLGPHRAQKSPSDPEDFSSTCRQPQVLAAQIVHGHRIGSTDDSLGTLAPVPGILSSVPETSVQVPGLPEPLPGSPGLRDTPLRGPETITIAFFLMLAGMPAPLPQEAGHLWLLLFRLLGVARLDTNSLNVALLWKHPRTESACQHLRMRCLRATHRQFDTSSLWDRGALCSFANRMER